MARLFDDGSSEYLQCNTTPITGFPITMSCWFHTDTITIYEVLLHVGSLTLSDGFRVACRGDAAGDPIELVCMENGGNTWTARTTSGFSANTWHHVFARADSATAGIIKIDDGGEGVDNDVSATPNSIDGIDIGSHRNAAGYFSGLIAEVAIWNLGLGGIHNTKLSKGYSPLFIYPQNLVAYWPLIRGLNDKVRGYNMTASGTVAAPHPRIICPTRPQIVYQPTAAPPPPGAGIMTLNTGFWGGV